MSGISPRVSALAVACRERRIGRCVRRCSISAFLSTPRAWTNRRAIDRLVRHPERLILGVGTLQPPGDLLRRPVASELRGHDCAAGAGASRAYTPSGAELDARPADPRPRRGTDQSHRCAPSSRLTVEGARPRPQAIRRNECPCASPREISSRSASVSASLRTSPRRRPDAAGRADVREDRGRALAEDPADRLEPFALVAIGPRSRHSHAAVKKRRFRRCRITLHLRLGKVKCCADRLRSPPEAAVQGRRNRPRFIDE